MLAGAFVILNIWSEVPIELRVVLLLEALVVWGDVAASRRHSLVFLLQRAARAPLDIALGVATILLPLIFASDSNSTTLPITMITLGLATYLWIWVASYGRHLLQVFGRELSYESGLNKVLAVAEWPLSSDQPAVSIAALSGISLLVLCGDLGAVVVGIPIIGVLWCLTVIRNRRLPTFQGRYLERRFRESFPNPVLFARFPLLTALGLALITSIISRELTLFYGSPADARGLLNSLLQVQASVGILTVTVLFVVVQIVSDAFSLRISVAAFRHRSFVTAVAVLAISVGINTWLSARLPTVISDTLTDSVWIDLSLIAAGAAFVLLVTAIFRIATRLTPESMIHGLLDGMTASWIRQVSAIWNDRLALRGDVDPLRDPMLAIERALMTSLQRRDLTTFRTICSQLYSAISTHTAAANVHAIDRYLLDHLSQVIEYALSNGQDEAVGELITILYWLPEPDLEHLKNGLRFGDEDIPGEGLIRRILKLAVEFGRDKAGNSCLGFIRDRGIKYARHLPNTSECYSLHPDIASIGESENPDDRERRISNDNFIMGFEQAYFSSIGWQITESVKRGNPELVYSGVSTICYVLSQGLRDHKDGGLRERLVYWATSALSEIAYTVAQYNATSLVGLGLYPLGDIADALNDDEPALADSLAGVVVSTLGSLAKSGILRHHDVVDISVFGYRLTARFPDAHRKVVEAFCIAAEVTRGLPGYEESRERKWVYRELVNRIRQQGTVLEYVREALEQLHEPEFSR